MGGPLPQFRFEAGQNLRDFHAFVLETELQMTRQRIVKVVLAGGSGPRLNRRRVPSDRPRSGVWR